VVGAFGCRVPSVIFMVFISPGLTTAFHNYEPLDKTESGARIPIEVTRRAAFQIHAHNFLAAATNESNQRYVRRRRIEAGGVWDTDPQNHSERERFLFLGTRRALRSGMCATEIMFFALAFRRDVSVLPGGEFQP